MKRGLIAGTFDLCHVGHVILLEECKRECDELIVALHIDPSKERCLKHKPVQTVFERHVILMSNKDVYGVIPYETEKDLKSIIANYNISTYFLGAEYKDIEFTGKNICEMNGIDVIFIPRNHDFSSSELRRRVYYAENDLKEYEL